MKLFISNDDKTIEGYIKINLTNLVNDLNNIVDNSCTQILAPNIIDSLPYNSGLNFIDQLYKKLRLTGLLTITGSDVEVISRSVMSSSINYEEYSNIISNKLSIRSLSQIQEYLSKYKDLQIETQIKGINYVITAIRT